MTTECQNWPSARRWHRGLSWLALLLFATAGPAVAQSPTQVELLLSAGDDPYREFSGAFQAELSLACAHRCAVTPSVRVSTVDDWQPNDPRDLLVAVGNEAAVNAVSAHPPRLLYGLIPESTWHNVERLHPSVAGNTSAVYLDQPIDRQFRLLGITLPAGRRRVGVLLGPESIRLEPRLRAAAARHGMVLVARRVNAWDEVGPAVESLAGEIDLLLAAPDPVVFNRDTLYGILLTSYRAGIPVAGYSRALVDAGAMLALYTSVPDMARHLAQISADYIVDGGALPDPMSSRYYEIAVNRNVARSLGFDLPEASELHTLMQSVGDVDDAAQAAQ